jgi:hypothetical protein
MDEYHFCYICTIHGKNKLSYMYQHEGITNHIEPKDPEEYV